MADLLYRAFISYSHADEAWAEWLHHQLESYRVPKHLVGREGEHGVVPARLVPVFRDRDELSTGNNLTGKILTALEQSEAMIVLCSPASAASRWVNEEIRQFRALGRENRIFCVLVDGDSKASITPSNALPPALFESATDQQFEPLAADPRKWADGKYLAKLKLIAGLLGVRLDELRQRDLKRRRKWQAVTGLAVIAALTLTAVAVISTISQRHEREKAEQLATFIVDLGERMQSDVDLETMGVISQEAARHLGGLDLEKLSLETRIRVGLVFRQLAHVSEGQGRPDEALEAYTRSRDMFRELQKKYPQDQKVLFELGQAEFYVGNLFFQQGDYDAARAPLESYLQASQNLLETDADKPEWIMELSYSITGLVALQIESGQGVDDKLLENVDKAVSLMETAMAQTPEDHTIVDHYATTLAWAADAQLEACNLEDAEISRRKVFALTESVSSADPSNNELKMGKAYALTGLANVLLKKGDVENAELHMLNAIAILEQLSAADPSNTIHQRDLLTRRASLAKLFSDTGRLEQAREIMVSIAPGFVLPLETSQIGESAIIDSIDFSLSYADIEFRLGNQAEAVRQLEKAVALLKMDTPATERDFLFRNRVDHARFLWWEIKKDQLFDSFPIDQSPAPAQTSSHLSCSSADIAARLAVMNGDLEAARLQHEYLAGRAYFQPAYMRFCRQYGLCPPP